MASRTDFLSISFVFWYGLALINLFIYAIAWQQILKHLPLTVAFCNKSVGMIWSMIWGVLIFKETLTLQMIIGSVIVLIGVLLVVTSDE